MKNHQRLTVLSFAFIMTMCFGAGYAWSVFAQELFRNYSFKMASAQLPFAFFQVAFAFGFIIGGRIIKKFGPRKVAFSGGIIMGAGFFAAGLFPPEPLKLIISIGLFGGFGAGLAYICPLETVQKCFPEKKAAVTGISVGGLGIGTFLMAIGVEYLLKSGMSVLLVWKILGVVFFLVIGGTALFLKTPAETCEEETKLLSYKEIFGSKNFWGLFAGMATSLFAGLMVIGNMKKMGMNWGMTELIATLGISVLALSNALGRIGWGFVIQKIGELKSIYISIMVMAVVMVASVFLVSDKISFFIFAVLVGSSYGCALVVYASSVSRYFGVERLGQIYPLIFASNFVSGLLAPPFAGYVFDITGSFNNALFVAAGILLIGVVSFKILFKHK